MKNWHIVLIGILASAIQITAQPVITKIFNNSDFIYQIVEHNGAYGCNKAQPKNAFLLGARSYSDEQILVGLQYPSIKLRPIAYLDAHVSKMYSFVDNKNEFDEKKIAQAFEVWKIYNHSSVKTAQKWFDEWIGGDIVVHHNYLEVLGYVMDLSKVVVANKQHVSTAWIHWSQGVFARLSLGITISQHSKKGIIPFVESYVGEGGLCKDGKVISI
jgi:hypothetical protein